MFANFWGMDTYDFVRVRTHQAPLKIQPIIDLILKYFQL